MKKTLALSLSLVALASLASAAPVMCGILMKGDSSTTVTSSSCSVNPDPGFFISALTLTATDDYTGLLLGSPVVSYAATLVQSDAVFTGALFCDVGTGIFGSQPCSVIILPASTVTSLNLSTFTVGLINGSNTVTNGNVIGASIILALDFVERPLPAAGIPEPTTLGLMGGALLGLVFLACKKKQ
jgi:hypothetical protein